MTKTKIEFMKVALGVALRGQASGEVPVGAVVVKDGEIIARAHNLKEKKGCAVYHAEVVAVERACKKLGTWHLDGCDVYVTLEPCAMCAGLLINSRVAHIYFGAYDAKAGCCGTLYNLPQDARFNHRAIVEGGIMERECAAALTAFFGAKRKGGGLC